MIIIALSLFLVFFSSLTQVNAIPQLEYVENTKRGTCNSNNCLRALLSPQHSSAAIDFCEKYISASTITVPSTVKTTETFSNLLAQPITTVIVTSTSTIFSTLTSTHSHSLPSPPPLTTSTPIPPFLNTTISLPTDTNSLNIILSLPTNSLNTTLPSNISTTLFPRDYHPPALPTFLSACSANPSKISSACSCIVAPVTYVTSGVVTSYAVTDVVVTLPAVTPTVGTVVVQHNTTTVTLYEP